MSHLTTRVLYSKGAVAVPVTALLAILSSPAYTDFTNVAIKTRVANRVHTFVKSFMTTE